MQYINKYIRSINVLGVVGRGRGVGRSVGVDSLALVGDLSDVAGVVVNGVVDVLDPAVGEGHGVGALGTACAVAGLSGVEVGVGVVVGDGVVVGVGGDLIGVHLGGVVGRGGVVSRSSMVDGMDHRGSVVGRGSVVSRGMDNGSSMVCGSMDNGGGVVGGSNNGMAGTMEGTVDSMDSSLAEVGSHTVGGSVGHRVVAGVGGDGGAKGLGLGVRPDLALVRLGHRHMRGLATAVADTVADNSVGQAVVGQQLGGCGRHQGGDSNESLKHGLLLRPKISQWVPTFMFGCFVFD